MKPVPTLVALALPALLVACTYAHLQQPQLAVVDVEFVKGDLFRQELRVRMRVTNPNDIELPVRGVTYQVELAGQAFAHGESSGGFLIPANGETEFDVNVSANAAGALVHLLGSDDPENPEYRVVGKVRLSAGMLRSIPFDHSGTLRLR